MSYYLIDPNEPGGATIRCFESVEFLKKHLIRYYYDEFRSGDRPSYADIDDVEHFQYLNNWLSKLILIRGDIIQPKIVPKGVDLEIDS